MIVCLTPPCKHGWCLSKPSLLCISLPLGPRGVNVAGHRGYFLTGPGVDLNLALINYGLWFLKKRGYDVPHLSILWVCHFCRSYLPQSFTKLQTPFLMKKDQMAKTAQLSEFDEALYKVLLILTPGNRRRRRWWQVLDCYLRATNFSVSCRGMDWWEGVAVKVF